MSLAVAATKTFPGARRVVSDVIQGHYRRAMITVPPSFYEMPRWWHDGSEWLDGLPQQVERYCRRWHLEVDGEPMHGSNALVVPVIQNRWPAALRLTPPDDDVAAEVQALRFWDGRGTVRLLEADEPGGATLLERLDGSKSLQDLPLRDAVPTLARMMRRLAVPGPTAAGSTAGIAAARLATFESDWRRHDQPFSEQALTAALDCATVLSSTTSDLAVNGDLHFKQVLRAEREDWLTVDPVLFRGDIEYDLARLLWSRLDEMSDADVHDHFRTIVNIADLTEERAAAWVLFRSIDYWLWGLDHGLTEDPVRCERLVRLFLPARTRDH